MIVHWLYRACRLLSFTACEWLSFKIVQHPCPQSGPTTLESLHASTNRRDAGPRSTHGPTISQCFCHHPCIDVLVSPIVPKFSSDYRLFLRGALNLHISVRSLSLVWVSCQQCRAVVTMHLLGCNAMLQILGRQLKGTPWYLHGTFHHDSLEAQPDTHTVQPWLCGRSQPRSQPLPTLAGDLAGLSSYLSCKIVWCDSGNFGQEMSHKD